MGLPKAELKEWVIMKVVKRYKLTVIKYTTRDVNVRPLNIKTTAVLLHRKVVKRVNPKSSHHKEIFFFYFFQFCIYMKWVGSLSLLQHIFPTQELNQGLLHCRQIFFTSWASRESLMKWWLFTKLILIIILWCI